MSIAIAGSLKADSPVSIRAGETALQVLAMDREIIPLIGLYSAPTHEQRGHPL